MSAATRTRRVAIYRLLIQAAAEPGALIIDVGAIVRTAILAAGAGLEAIDVRGRVVTIEDAGCVVELESDVPGLAGERYVPWGRVVPLSPVPGRGDASAAA